MSARGRGPMTWAEARVMIDRMLDRAETTYPLMLLQLGAQARAVQAALDHITTLEKACATADDVFDELALHECGRCTIDSVDTCVRRIREKIGAYREARAR